MLPIGWRGEHPSLRKANMQSTFAFLPKKARFSRPQPWKQVKQEHAITARKVKGKLVAFAGNQRLLL